MRLAADGLDPNQALNRIALATCRVFTQMTTRTLSLHFLRVISSENQNKSAQQNDHMECSLATD